MLKKIKSFLKQDIKALDNFDLKKKFPNYFNIKIFRLMWILLLVVMIWDLSLNDWSFQTVKVSCDSDYPCINPFYKCPEGYDSNLYTHLLNTPGSEMLVCSQNPPDFICEQGLCSSQYLEPGFSFGRTDLLARFGWFILIVVIPGLAFLFNHVNYYFRTGNWRYKKR